MSRKHTDIEAPAATLKNEFARQRWELFHRAIAHAKRSNDDALAETDGQPPETDRPVLSVVR